MLVQKSLILGSELSAADIGPELHDLFEACSQKAPLTSGVDLAARLRKQEGLQFPGASPSQIASAEELGLVVGERRFAVGISNRLGGQREP